MFGFLSGVYRFPKSVVTTFSTNIQTSASTTTTFSTAIAVNTTFATTRATTTTFNTSKATSKATTTTFNTSRATAFTVRQPASGDRFANYSGYAATATSYTWAQVASSGLLHKLWWQAGFPPNNLVNVTSVSIGTTTYYRGAYRLQAT